MAKSIWPNDDQTDTLLAAARGGDDEAVNRLLEKHRAPVRRLVELRLDRKVQQRVDVSDVVQDVMIEASGRLRKYLDNPSMAFHLWLRQIAWDRIIDTYRRHRVSARLLDRRGRTLWWPARPDTWRRRRLRHRSQLPASGTPHRAVCRGRTGPGQSSFRTHPREP